MKLDIGAAELAVDDDSVAVDMLDRTYEGGRLDVRADAHALPFRTRSVDGVHSGMCIITYTKMVALDEVDRVLKHGGTLKMRVKCGGPRRIVQGWIQVNRYKITDAYFDNAYRGSHDLDWFVTATKT